MLTQAIHVYAGKDASKWRWKAKRVITMSKHRDERNFLALISHFCPLFSVLFPCRVHLKKDDRRIDENEEKQNFSSTRIVFGIFVIELFFFLIKFRQMLF